MDLSQISCKNCKHKKKCQGRVRKGSSLCKQRLGLIEKKEGKQYHPHILLWAVYNKGKGIL